jgi:hypothetical protein
VGKAEGGKRESGNETGLVTAGYFGLVFYRRGAEAQKQAVDRMTELTGWPRGGAKAKSEKAETKQRAFLPKDGARNGKQPGFSCRVKANSLAIRLNFGRKNELGKRMGAHE